MTVEGVRVRPTRRRNLVIVEARVRDESGPGVLVWFNQRYLAKQLKPGMRLSVRGERRRHDRRRDRRASRHELLGADESLTHTSGLVPVYHSSEKLTSRRIGDLVTAQLGHVGDAPDSLPVGLRSPPRPAAAPRRAARGAPPATRSIRPARPSSGWPSRSCSCCRSG